MTSSHPGVSPLRQRMIDDMHMRQLSPKTQATYLRIVREFARFLGRSPDTATVEDLRRYQLHLVDHGTSPVSLNAAITGLKFFFEITLDRPELMVDGTDGRGQREDDVVVLHGQQVSLARLEPAMCGTGLALRAESPRRPRAVGARQLE